MSEIDVKAHIESSWQAGESILASRTIVFNAFITQETANDLIGHLLMLDHLSQDPILLRINTEGGQVHDGLAIYDTMRHLKAPIITLAEMICGGFGLVMLMAGAKRYALPHSHLEHVPLRQPTTISSMPSDIVVLSGEVTRLSGSITQIIQRHTAEPNPLKRLFAGNKPPWDLSKPRIFTRDEALRYKLIDEVVQSFQDIPR